MVDKENGVLYQDATALEPSKKERYTLMVGNLNRTQGLNEDGDVHTDVISNKQISHGKCQMCCGHFTGTSFMYLKLILKQLFSDVKITFYSVVYLSFISHKLLIAGRVLADIKDICYVLHTKKNHHMGEKSVNYVKTHYFKKNSITSSDNSSMSTYTN